MNRLAYRIVLCLASASLLSACAGNGNTPGSGTPNQGASFQVADDATLANLSGQYLGSVQDSGYGKGRLKGSLAQYKTALGGSLRVTAAKVSITTANTWSISNGTDLTGTGAATVANAVCVYSFTGKYDATTHRLAGSYHAFHGCSGQKGTYTIKQLCFYARDGAIGKDTGLKQC